jgi:hypothetical protein
MKHQQNESIVDEKPSEINGTLFIVEDSPLFSVLWSLHINKKREESAKAVARSLLFLIVYGPGSLMGVLFDHRVSIGKQSLGYIKTIISEKQ